jgi:hypothetical protein
LWERTTCSALLTIQFEEQIGEQLGNIHNILTVWA